MNQPQEAIFVEGSNHYYYLEYTFNESATVQQCRHSIQKALSAQINGVNVVIGFGHKAWNALQANWCPNQFCNFETLNGVKGYSMPSTQHDVFFWIHSNAQDDNFDQVLKIQETMQEIAELALDLPGFNYHNNLDLIGFEDGTANPKEGDRMLAALVPNTQIGAGGSFVLSQKWVHNLNAFNALSDHEQGQVIGRRKHDNEELEGDNMPIDSHISRTDLKKDGKALKIYRRSDPFGNATEHGLYFLAFSCEMERLSLQLESMLGMTEDKIHDKLIEFSQATTSSYWFAPSAADLKNMLKE